MQSHRIQSPECAAGRRLKSRVCARRFPRWRGTTASAVCGCGETRCPTSDSSDEYNRRTRNARRCARAKAGHRRSGHRKTPRSSGIAPDTRGRPLPWQSVLQTRSRSWEIRAKAHLYGSGQVTISLSHRDNHEFTGLKQRGMLNFDIGSRV